MLESEIQKQITNYLDLRRVLWWRLALGGLRFKGGRGKNPLKGFPDIGFVVPGGTGRLGAIECKLPKGGKWYPEQVQWREKLESQGVLYIVGDSLDAVADRLVAYERTGA